MITKKNKSIISRLGLFRSVDNSPLIVFRIAFYLIIAYECIFALLHINVAPQPPHPHFTFIGFECLGFLEGKWLAALFSVLFISSLLSSVGLYYRISSIISAFLWTIFYFSDKSVYNNHYYLMMLLLWFLTLVPAHERYSFDCKRSPNIASNLCKNWHLQIFVLQIFLLYFFAGITKISSDWLHGYPEKLWLPQLKVFWPLTVLFKQSWFALFVSFISLLFDITIVPLLLFKPTKNIALWLAVIFHILNSMIFNIGTFPYTCVVLLIFFAPNDAAKWVPFEKEMHAIILAGPAYKKRVGILLAIYFLLQCL
jgi:vitamin K-dependent gamma-carboxylase